MARPRLEPLVQLSVGPMGIPSWAAYTVCVHTILGGVEAVGPANTEHV